MTIRPIASTRAIAGPAPLAASGCQLGLTLDSFLMRGVAPRSAISVARCQTEGPGVAGLCRKPALLPRKVTLDTNGPCDRECDTKWRICV
jgi:hypothetical protein